jgi:tripeptide aminopeptidase
VSAAGGVVELFCDLAAISSPSRDERAVADRVLEALDRMGLDPVEDGSGAETGSNMGNIHCVLAPTGEGGTPIFLNAHLDTVPPDGPVEPEIRNGIVVNRRDTILGADNKAAVAVMLAAVERLARGVPHAGVELVLTPMEEVGLRGAKAFDLGRLHARLGYCYDHAAPIGHVVLAAPTQKSLELRFVGRAAHSGIAPEEGRSAIAAAARAIADMPLGRIDAATTANVGLVRGGVAGNIVPPECRVWAEARSRDPDRLREQVQAMLDAATYAANLAECEVETRIVSEYEGYRLARTHEAVRLVSAALEGSGYPVTYIDSGGGADANVFNAAGVPCVNVCNGMAEIHTANEHIALADLEGMLSVTMRLIQAARTMRPDEASNIAQPDEDGGTT